jgi:hypothetical protein
MSISRDLLFALALIGCFIFLSTFPFYPIRSIAGMSGALRGFLDFTVADPIGQTVFERFAFLVPVGFFIGRAMRGRIFVQQCVVLAVGSLLLGFLLELVQVPVVVHHVRLSDALIAVIGIAGGYALAARFVAPRREYVALAWLAAAWSCALVLIAVLIVGPPTT